MDITINLSALCYSILFILVAAALVYLILVLIKLNKILSRVDTITYKNEENINEILESLPKTASNFEELSENAKDVSDVVTQFTADAIDKTETAKDYIQTALDIISIIKKVFKSSK